MNAPRRSRVRVTALALALTLLAGLAALVPATAAHAAQYRYWTYWWGSGAGWQYASLGPSYDNGRIQDGLVVGWHFGTTGPNGGGAQPPRHSAAVSCPKAPTGQVSIGLVVDFGTSADTPPGDHRPLANAVQVSCVAVSRGSNGAAVLAAAGIDIRWRASDGLVCGLGGYPSTECPALVADPAPTRTPAPSGTHTTAAVTGPGTATATPSGHSPSASRPPSPPPAPAVAGSSPAGAAVGVILPEQTLPAAPAGALAAQAPSSTGSPWPIAVVGLVLAALGAGTWWTRRRGPT